MRRPRRPLSLEQRVQKLCEERGLLSGRSLAVAVSGGVDSMCLMHLLWRLGHRPVVLSCDHGLRPEAAEELDLVEAEAGARGLEFRRFRLNLRPGPDAAARARRARYEVFDQSGMDRIALGHHQQDRAETFLDRAIRGAGTGGLGGMRYRRGPYVRPLLELKREELLRYAEEQGLPWREDPSNRSGTRGRIRAELLPLLEDLRAGAVQSLARASRWAAEDDACLQELAEDLFEEEQLSWTRWRVASPPLARRALMRLIQDAGGPQPVARQLDAVSRLQGAGEVRLSSGWRCLLDEGRLRCLPPPPQPGCLRSGQWGIWHLQSARPLEVCTLGTLPPPERAAMRPLLRAHEVSNCLLEYEPLFRCSAGVWRSPRDPGLVKGQDGAQIHWERRACFSWSGVRPLRVRL